MGGQQIRSFGRKGAGRDPSKRRRADVSAPSTARASPSTQSVAPHEHSMHNFRSPHLLLSVRAALSSSTLTQRELRSQQKHVISHESRNAEVGMCLCSPPTPTGVRWNTMLSSVRWIFSVSKNGDSIASFHLQTHN